MGAQRAGVGGTVQGVHAPAQLPEDGRLVVGQAPVDDAAFVVIAAHGAEHAGEVVEAGFVARVHGDALLVEADALVPVGVHQRETPGEAQDAGVVGQVAPGEGEFGAGQGIIGHAPGGEQGGGVVGLAGVGLEAARGVEGVARPVQAGGGGVQTGVIEDRVDVAQQAPGAVEGGVARGGVPEQAHGLIERATGVPGAGVVDGEIVGVEVKLVGGEVGGGLAVHGVPLGGGEADGQAGGDLRGDLVLDGEEAVRGAVVAFGPDVGVGARVDQLRGDAHLAAFAGDAAFQDVGDAQVAADVAHVEARGIAVGHDAGAGDDFQGRRRARGR